MSQDEYVLGLLAIISGLAVTEWMTSLHAMLVNRHIVKWDWLAMLAAVFIVYAVAFSWWISWRSFHTYSEPIPFRDFLQALLQTAAIYLASRTVLPDATAESNELVDLRKHYARVSRQVWGALFVSIALSLPYYIVILIEERTLFPSGGLISGLPGTLGYAGFCLTLALVRSRKVHAVLVPMMFAISLFFTMRASL